MACPPSNKKSVAAILVPRQRYDALVLGHHPPQKVQEKIPRLRRQAVPPAREALQLLKNTHRLHIPVSFHSHAFIFRQAYACTNT